MRYKEFLSCAVVGDPLWDSLVNEEFVEKEDGGSHKPDGGEKVRRRILQTVGGVSDSRPNVNTESGPFRDLPRWEKDKLLDRAATNKEYDIVSDSEQLENPNSCQSCSCVAYTYEID